MPRLLDTCNVSPERGLETFSSIEEKGEGNKNQFQATKALPNKIIKMCLFLQALFQVSPDVTDTRKLKFCLVTKTNQYL